ncbi:Ectoine hydroxylase-related dioxygenase, phytanoyl-CoA dioxygenase (PhyH) family [Streptosporangium subroseum]|uniref:Ectoine hydroxylase-related dioxygenase, phytanoyl-CoA dioxygenase (PhyH) family n=1 Tax=Streptosporangium subroseum TaxID=106412 RepID=A0A239DST8_9ACTN|nr:phytanoyl-CoA dioxygenase family protein [Streptosporangium subroseum]SNS35191.1 Ectoine hydroxylase-related dioxygenase, phytanoyl-CoA dioxygenase (PhyH) family [Streptosporangium subroseum]
MTVTHHDLKSRYDLDAAAVRYFDDNGFVKLPGVLDAGTIAAYEPEITSKVVELNTQHLPLAERDTYGKAFLQVTNLWRHSDLVREFVFSPRLARIAAELLGVAGVRLYHDQALYKESGGGITPWHADQYYWPLATDRTVTVWVPLQETPAEMGPLAFAAGSHRFEYGRDLPISDESERELQQGLAEQNFPPVETPYRLGEVSYHLGWTFHHAAPNRSGVPRRVMTVIYMDADITVSQPMNDNQRHDLRSWMSGAEVGAVPETPLNPVLYRARGGAQTG